MATEEMALEGTFVVGTGAPPQVIQLILRKGKFVLNQVTITISIHYQGSLPPLCPIGGTSTLQQSLDRAPALLDDDEGHDREGEEDGGEVDGDGDGERSDEARHDHLGHCLCTDKLLELLILSQQYQKAFGLSINPCFLTQHIF